MGEQDQLDIWNLPPLEVGSTLPLDKLVGRTEHGAAIFRSLRIFTNVLGVTVELFRAPDMSDDDWVAAIAPRHPVLLDDPEIVAALRFEREINEFEPMHTGQSGCNQRYCRSEFWTALDPDRLPAVLRISWIGEGQAEIDLPVSDIAAAMMASHPIW